MNMTRRTIIIVLHLILSSKSFGLLTHKITHPTRTKTSMHAESSPVKVKTEQSNSKTEGVDLLAKESFFCFRMKDQENTCIVECKRIDDKPLGYGMGGWSSEDSGKRRTFAFSQNVDPVSKIYRKF